MSTTLASLLVLALFAVACVPLAIAYRKRGAAPAALAIYGALFAGALVYHSGLLTAGEARLTEADRKVLASSPKSAAGGLAGGPFDAATAAPPREACLQALKVAEEARLFERSGPTRFVVNPALWPRLPAEARDALRRCLEASGPAGSKPVEVVGAE